MNPSNLVNPVVHRADPSRVSVLLTILLEAGNERSSSSGTTDRRSGEPSIVAQYEIHPQSPRTRTMTLTSTSLARRSGLCGARDLRHLRVHPCDSQRRASGSPVRMGALLIAAGTEGKRPRCLLQDPHPPCGGGFQVSATDIEIQPVRHQPQAPPGGDPLGAHESVLLDKFGMTWIRATTEPPTRPRSRGCRPVGPDAVDETTVGRVKETEVGHC